jgi:macrolide transport system ATP-binding/permease protein
LVTHERDLAEVADRIITVRDGRIISDETTTASPALEERELPPIEPYRELTFDNKFDARMHEAGSLGWMAILAALRAIGRNKLRAGLTMLGVFIGVAALIAMVAVGEGGHCGGCRRLENRLVSGGLADIVAGGCDYRGVCVFRGGRDLLRLLPRASGVPPESHRCLTL